MLRFSHWLSYMSLCLTKRNVFIGPRTLQQNITKMHLFFCIKMCGVQTHLLKRTRFCKLSVTHAVFSCHDLDLNLAGIASSVRACLLHLTRLPLSLTIPFFFFFTLSCKNRHPVGGSVMVLRPSHQDRL